MKKKYEDDANVGRIGYALKLTKYLGGYQWYLVVAVICNLIFKILPLLISFATSMMVSLVLLHKSELIAQMLAGVFLLVVLDALFSYLDILISHDMTYRILTKLRDLTYDKISELSPAIMVGEQSGNFISIILDDVEVLEWFYAHVIAQLIVAVLIPVGMLYFLFRLSPVLAIVICPFIVLLIMVPWLEEKLSNQQGSKVRYFAGALNAEIIDGVQGLREILSFGWQKKYFERFSKIEKQYREANMQYEYRSAKDTSIMNLIVEIAGIVVDITASYLVLTGQIRMVYLLPVFLLSTGIFAPIMDALTMSNNYGLIFGAAKRVLELLDRKTLTKDTGNLLSQDIDQNNEEVISFENVAFSYPEVEKEKNPQILRDISFSVKSGETIALVGASGCGKTTISRLLLRFWDCDEGSIKIFGENIRDIRISELQKLLTVVPQETFLFARTIKENMQLAKETATDEEIEEALTLAQAKEYIDCFKDGIDTVLGERGLRLSGGEKKRIAIAQAILKNAPIIILDESSANLDSENESKINQAINTLKEGKATIMIAHRVATMKSADRIVFLENGCVAASGDYEELLQNNMAFKKLIGEAG